LYRFVSNQELAKINRGKIHLVTTDVNEAEKKPLPKVPYKKLFIDMPILGNVLATAFVQIGYWLYVQFGPIYMNKVSL
jgi:hypothetical protein